MLVDGLAKVGTPRNSAVDRLLETSDARGNQRIKLRPIRPPTIVAVDAVTLVDPPLLPTVAPVDIPMANPTALAMYLQ